jgi:hypothetical protein
MDEPVVGAPTIPFEILWNDLEQYLLAKGAFGYENNVRLFSNHNSELNKFFTSINSPSVNSRSQLVAWTEHFIFHVFL